MWSYNHKNMAFMLITGLIATVRGAALSCAPAFECPTFKTSQYDVSSNILDMTTVAGVDAAASGSVTFDPERQEFVYIDAYNGVDDAWKPGLNTINTNFADESVTDPGFQGETHLTETLDELLTHWPYFVGAEIANDMLYQVDAYGRLIAIELETHDVVNFVDLVTIDDTFQASSVCIDEVSMMAYVVDGFQGALYRVDIGNDVWSVETLSAIGSTITDINGANPRVFLPSDCTVMIDKVFMAENNANLVNGALGVYDIDSGAYMYDVDVLSEQAYTIASSNGILVVGNTAAEIFIYDCCDSTQTSFANPADLTTIGNDFLQKITIDWINGVIVAAVMDQDTGLGYLEFVSSEDLIFIAPTVDPTLEPTLSPSAMPSTTPSAVPSTTPSAMPSTTPSAMPITSTLVAQATIDNKAYQCRSTFVFISVLFVLLFHNF
eukprot:1136832_1